MITAIMLMSLAAMTMTLLGTTIINQARRTQILSEDAELRQLLIAGAAFAEIEAESNSAGRVSVPLPDPLERNSAGLTIEFHSNSPTEKIAEVEASLPHHRLSQQLTVSFENGLWQLTAANLNR
jgi:hypothetical protein